MDFEEIKRIANLIDKELMENKGFYDVFPEDGHICIDVRDGDWKHDHLFVDYIARKVIERNGLKVTDIDVDVTEEDGSDTYSALHTIKISK